MFLHTRLVQLLVGRKRVQGARHCVEGQPRQYVVDKPQRYSACRMRFTVYVGEADLSNVAFRHCFEIVLHLCVVVRRVKKQYVLRCVAEIITGCCTFVLWCVVLQCAASLCRSASCQEIAHYEKSCCSVWQTVLQCVTPCGVMRCVKETARRQKSAR